MHRTCASTRKTRDGRCADCANRRAKKKAAAYRTELLALFGNRCARCGFDDSRALQIDHVFGDGRKERTKKFKSNYSYYLHVKQNLHTNRYQLLCANCNQIKKVENNEVDRRQEVQ